MPRWTGVGSKQQLYSPDRHGNQNWQNNSQPYPTSAAPAQPNQVAQNQATKTQNICGEADGVRYEILYRDVNSIVQCHLQPKRQHEQ